MRTTPAHEILQSRDCTYRACPNEARPGQDRCSLHERAGDVLLNERTWCPWEGCDWKFDGTGLRGAGFLKVHIESKHDGKLPNVDDFPPLPPLVARADPPELPSLPDLPELPPVLVPAPAPEMAPVIFKGSELPQPPKETKMAERQIDTERRERYLEQFRSFHDKFQRWPLPADAREQPHALPSGDVVNQYAGGYQSLWTELGAGKMPMGRAAANYRKTPDMPVLEPNKKPVTGPVEEEVEMENLSAEEEIAREAGRAGMMEPEPLTLARIAARLEDAASALDSAKQVYDAALAEFEGHEFFSSRRLEICAV